MGGVISRKNARCENLACEGGAHASFGVVAKAPVTNAPHTTSRIDLRGKSESAHICGPVSPPPATLPPYTKQHQLYFSARIFQALVSTRAHHTRWPPASSRARPPSPHRRAQTMTMWRSSHRRLASCQGPPCVLCGQTPAPATRSDACSQRPARVL